MAQFYRFYVTNGEDSQTAALVWADSDSEALDAGFEEISGVRYRLLAKEWGINPSEPGDDDAFFTTSCILDEARGLVLVDGKDGTVTEALGELLWDYLTEMSPNSPESSRGDTMRELCGEILRLSN